MVTAAADGQPPARPPAQHVHHNCVCRRIYEANPLISLLPPPLQIRVYINSIWRDVESHRLDLIALIFISVNPIIDPWVFILLSPSVLHFLWSSLCSASLLLSRNSVLKSSLAKDSSPVNVRLTRPPPENPERFPSAENL